jgi:hypothetical protein
MRQLTANDLLLLDFELFVKEINEAYEDTMQDIEHGTQYMYAEDGYMIYNTSCGITLTFSWMSSSFWVGKDKKFNYSTRVHCHDPELKLLNAELINDDGCLMNEREIHNTLTLFIEDTLSFEQEVEKDLPPIACGE